LEFALGREVAIYSLFEFAGRAARLSDVGRASVGGGIEYEYEYEYRFTEYE